MNRHDTTGGLPPTSQRTHNAPFLLLEQLDPTEVVDCIPVDDGLWAEDIVLAGAMRETCPECKTEHLQMVLRQKNVKRAHMFCRQCTRCFDACYPDGSPAFALV